MNEELTLAIEELRLRPTCKTWFIPVRLDECKIPPRSIGAGETLQDLQRIDIYEDWINGVRSLSSLFTPHSAYYDSLFTKAKTEWNSRLWTRSQKLTEPATIALVGMSGHGKSSLCAHLGSHRPIEKTEWAFTDRDIRYCFYRDGRSALVDIFSGWCVSRKPPSTEVHQLLMRESTFVFYVMSMGSSSTLYKDSQDAVAFLTQSVGVHCSIILNKIDLSSTHDVSDLVKFIETSTGCSVLPISAHTGMNIPLLTEFLDSLVQHVRPSKVKRNLWSKIRRLFNG